MTYPSAWRLRRQSSGDDSRISQGQHVTFVGYSI
jgi:hypothetical protein